MCNAEAWNGLVSCVLLLFEYVQWYEVTQSSARKLSSAKIQSFEIGCSALRKLVWELDARHHGQYTQHDLVNIDFIFPEVLFNALLDTCCRIKDLSQQKFIHSRSQLVIVMVK